MYLKNISIQNYGPLRDLQIDLPFDEAGNSRPLILVGLNGSGKSLTLSVILDALVSMRQVVYADVPEIKKISYLNRSDRRLEHTDKPIFREQNAAFRGLMVA